MAIPIVNDLLVILPHPSFEVCTLVLFYHKLAQRTRALSYSSGVVQSSLAGESKGRYPAITFLNSSVSTGTTLNRSATMP